MSDINLGRVFLGGAAAGALAVAIQYVAFFLGAYRRLSEVTGVNWHDFPVSTHLTVAAMEILVGGPLAIWLYAAIRPRFGAGPRTAVIAATFLWAALCLYGITLLTVLGLFVKLPVTLLVILYGTSLPFLICATLVGAKVYQEDGAGAAAAHTVGK